MQTPYSVDTLRIHALRALTPGPRLIVLGAVHGNETCGTRAIERVLREHDAAAWQLARGSVTFVPVTNPLAYQRGQRMGERNLNRNLRPNEQPLDNEDRIANRLCPLLAEHDVLLDLHSFHSPGEPFAMIGPTDNDGALEPFHHAREEEALALRLGPRRIVEGWLDTYATGVRNRLQRAGAHPSERARLLNTDPSYGVGTTEYMRTTGGYALTLECGQHADPAAPEVAYRAIMNTLAFLKIVEAPEPAPIAQSEMEALEMVVVHDKIDANDQFTRQWASFDPLSEGDQIGVRANGTPVLAEFGGRILFPDTNAGPNQEWYYLTRPNAGFGRE